MSVLELVVAGVFTVALLTVMAWGWIIAIALLKDVRRSNGDDASPVRNVSQPAQRMQRAFRALPSFFV
jgi:hypothetical protein